MGLSMARCVVLSLLLPWLVGGSAFARPEPQLSARQTILEANRHLIADGWRPAPEKSQRLRNGAGPLLRSRAFQPVPARALASAALITAETCSGCRW